MQSLHSKLDFRAWIHRLASEPRFRVWIQILGSEPGFRARIHSLHSAGLDSQPGMSKMTKCSITQIFNNAQYFSKYAQMNNTQSSTTASQLEFKARIQSRDSEPTFRKTQRFPKIDLKRDAPNSSNPQPGTALALFLFNFRRPVRAPPLGTLQGPSEAPTERVRGPNEARKGPEQGPKAVQNRPKKGPLQISRNGGATPTNFGASGNALALRFPIFF